MTLDRSRANAVLRDLRRARRRHQLVELDWVDALYKAYVTALFSLVGLFFAALAVGGDLLSPSALATVEADGPAWCGLGFAVAIALGLRSGSRGGPLAIEAADVVHVLLAPIERALPLRAFALRQLRGVALVGLLGGAVVGLLAAPRFSGTTAQQYAEWVLADGAVGLLVALAVWGSALVASGRRWSRLLVTAIGALLLVWSLADLLGGVATSPLTWLGSLALAPLALAPSAFVGAVAVLGIPLLGLQGIGGSSIEAAVHRSALVGQLRFAATVQDIRTVIVLHRQLALEGSRSRPWRRPGPGATSPPGLACWRRGWAGVARWPVGRIGRVLTLGLVAGVAAAGVWRGTTALLVVSGLAMFVAGLDAIEPFAQEVDHADRAEGLPVVGGALLVRHLAVPMVVLGIAGASGLVVAWIVDPAPTALGVAVATVVPVAVAGVVGAALAVLLGAPAVTTGVLVLTPEIQSVALVMRQVLPPALVVSAFLPVLAARSAAHGSGSALNAAAGAALPALVLGAIGIAFLRSRRSVTL